MNSNSQIRIHSNKARHYYYLQRWTIIEDFTLEMVKTIRLRVLLQPTRNKLSLLHSSRKHRLRSDTSLTSEILRILRAIGSFFRPTFVIFFSLQKIIFLEYSNQTITAYWKKPITDRFGRTAFQVRIVQFDRDEILSRLTAINNDLYLREDGGKYNSSIFDKKKGCPFR